MSRMSVDWDCRGELVAIELPGMFQSEWEWICCCGGSRLAIEGISHFRSGI